MNKRVFVRKKENYRKEEESLCFSLNQEYDFKLNKLEIYNIYDVYNISESLFEKAKDSVFAEKMIDDVFEEIKLVENAFFAYENLPAQYDQRADSAMQCISLLGSNEKVLVRSGKLVVFDRVLSAEELSLVKKYLVNPIESRQKDISVLEFSISSDVKPLRDMTGFNILDEEGLLNIKKEMSLAMNVDDLKFIQSYFSKKGVEPTETEIYVLDCYWSDHCRHTTFETVLDDIEFSSALFNDEIKDAFNKYLQMREEMNITKPITLMDMASIFGKYHKNILKDENIEISDEVNACSFFTDIETNGEKEKWLIQFKNETHNHPSEIEPFGGASTCIGGAIRDPLSGRSYVYQAMRVSGSGNILQRRKDTLKNKLPQVDISKNTALGNSSYGNQIGLATTFVRELYDDSYIAKHMEVGAVVGAVKSDNYKREKLSPGDIVLVIGGRTGRDGIQGASGSSISHSDNSLEEASSQVQKGNAIEERKLQRLFRNPKVTKMIKKCNDFGAGGVCVAIGELSDGVEIHLDKVLLKYKGLNATEIATSESQERMAVVIDKLDYEEFIKECENENIEYSRVAEITDRKKLEMFYYGQKVVDMDADFLETSGVRQHSRAIVVDNNKLNPFDNKEVTKSNILNELKELNVTCQKGMAQMFDSSIGATTVLMPFSGKNKITPVQASVQAIPTINKDSDTATILAYGFIPKISHYSPFLSSIYAVLESVAKVYSVGGSKENLYFSFQEYFEKLNKEPKKWGKVVQSLLGAIYAQNAIKRPSIGGKDSMSGTFNDINVVETLISFACSTEKVKNIITPHLKELGNKIYYIDVVKNDKGYPYIEKTLEKYEILKEKIRENKIVSAYVLDESSIVASLIKMAIGNNVGFTVNKENILNFNPASIVVESTEELPFEYLGEVTENIKINGIDLTFDELWNEYTSTLNEIYPIYENNNEKNCENIVTKLENKRFYPEYIKDVNVLIPVFPGTNCEYDTMKSFIEAGAKVSTVIIKNKNEADIENSIDEFVNKIRASHIIAFAGGFSSGDEPDGSAKFIVNVLKNEKVKEAIKLHLKDKKLILGICNGFQALIKSGLIPYGEIRDLSENDLTLYRNDSYKHISTTAFTRVSNNNSPWLQDFAIDKIHEVVFSHGEGKIVGKDIEKFKHLISFQYCDLEGNATINGKYNPNGSLYAAEGMISFDGLVLGKMGHSERFGENLYITNTIREKQDIFKNGVNYFKGAKN